MDREYRPEEVEKRWAAEWAAEKLFEARPDSDAEPFCMVIPPPNVTGNLHIGHVLVYTLHDVVARWRRMQGRDVLWLPGTDHAGIATQMVVERELAKEGIERHELGREAFEARVWEWKEEFGGRITGALRTLGSSVDWSRERFTLDEGLSRAVREVFVRLYNDGLIYRDRYTVNWCPRCQTAISDLETVHQPTQGKLYTVRYLPAAGDGPEIRVATTRPETILGDTGVAVHPDDERYKALVGQNVRVPLTDRDVPVVADSFVDREFGTGAVKLTPSHDPNDFEAGRRLGLPELAALDASAKMTEIAGPYAGLDRFEARKRIVADLDGAGLLVETKDHEHAVGHCQRCNTMIEPLASTQWFVKIDPLAKPAIEAVESGKSRFLPESWSKTYFEWMRNIHDWCISRQLWWGHRIPAWYCDSCEEVFVAESEPEACANCNGGLRQEEDVLDTWFSSALWPFSTMGWPEKTQDLDRYYPTSLLITGHDIIFFWVARMMMMGLRFQGDVPFHDIYIHGLVRDAEGQKMSKTKGNTIDPAEVQARYGTDAVRFTMSILAAPGNDIPLAPERMEGYRAFANKLWNAARFVMMQLEQGSDDVPEERWSLSERWIVSPLARDAARGEPRLRGVSLRPRGGRDLPLRVGRVLRLVHRDGEARPAERRRGWSPGARGAAPGARHAPADAPPDDALHYRGAVVEASGKGLPPGGRALARAGRGTYRCRRRSRGRAAPLPGSEDPQPPGGVEHRSGPDDPRARAFRRRIGFGAVAREATLVGSLARAEEVTCVDAFPEKLVAARGVAGPLEVAIPLEGLLDLDVERTRLQKDLAKVEKELTSRSKRLKNREFLDRAPAEVVEKERRIERELIERRDRLDQSLARLSSH